MTDYEIIVLILKYFGAGLALAMMYLTGYRDREKEKEDEE